MQGKKMLVVTAHPGDILWRCSGAVAKHTKNGGDVHIVVLTHGIGGEANELMALEGMTVKKAKELRERDTQKAAQILGVSNIEFWDYPDYCFEISQDKVLRLAAGLRLYKPDLILTHHKKDILNPDHGNVGHFVNLACEVASGLGVEIEGTKPGLDRTPVFGFEPHVTEANDFEPDIFVDISEVIEVKREAMSCFEGKKALAKSYLERAALRGGNAKSFGNRNCKYAEAFTMMYPISQYGDFVY
ncbi:hypothetical protein BTR23_18630 [Alkalihalophilus pseudofirmus]|nr:hypothetical protein BTR23_18630 [Alkalihalophilus pseudofirmus]